MGLISQTGENPPFGVAHGVGVRKYGITPYSKRAAGTELKILPSGMGYLVKLVSLKHWHWPESSGETPDQRKVYVYGSAGNRSVSCRLASDFTPPPTQKKNPPHGRVWSVRAAVSPLQQRRACRLCQSRLLHCLAGVGFARQWRHRPGLLGALGKSLAASAAQRPRSHAGCKFHQNVCPVR